MRFGIGAKMKKIDWNTIRQDCEPYHFRQVMVGAGYDERNPSHATEARSGQRSGHHGLHYSAGGVMHQGENVDRPGNNIHRTVPKVRPNRSSFRKSER